MYVARVPNRNSPPAILVREGYREDGKVKNRTLANISKLPLHAINVLDQALKGKQMIAAEDDITIVEDGSKTHGNVEAVLKTMRRLGFAQLINSRRSKQRDLVVSMVAARIINPQSKLATTRWWHTTTLPQIMETTDADEDDLYEAMDWLLERQANIERKLAKRHLHPGSLALYDLTSSYFEGKCCSLAAWGHNRDGKKGKLQVNYGLLTNDEGIPIAVSVFEGNRGDAKTLLPQIRTMQDSFAIKHFILVGDRGMITQKQVDLLQNIDGVDWITALRPEAIRKLLSAGAIQMGLFDERNLFELTHPDFPDERLVACRNPDLARRRAAKRTALIEATVRELDTVVRMVQRGLLCGKRDIVAAAKKVLNSYRIGKFYTIEGCDDGFSYKLDRTAMKNAIVANSRGDQDLLKKRMLRAEKHVKTIEKKLKAVRDKTQQGQLHGKENIALRVGKVINKYRVAKHFVLHIEDNSFRYELDQNRIDEEASMDGVYVVRTSLASETMDADQTVRSYKQLSNVERAFRSLKSVDLMVRPIRHRLEDRVRAHIFLCALAYYVQWHMTAAWRPLLFVDEEQQHKQSRDPVAPAQRSESAMRKVQSRRLEDNSSTHSFRTLLDSLASIVQNTCSIPCSKKRPATFEITTSPNRKQQQALTLLDSIATPRC